LSPEVSPKSWEISSPPSPGVTGVTCGLFSPWSVTHDEKTTTTTTETPQFQSPEAGRLPLVAGSHEWIRKANSELDRQRRRLAAEQTMSVCQVKGYVLDGQYQALTSLEIMCRNTRVVARKSTQLPKLSQGLIRSWHHHPPGGLLDVACGRASAGLPTVAVNAASAYHVGGGFHTGGRHALEESICMRSTLINSLKVAESTSCQPSVHCQPKMKAPGVPWTCHIPETGCIISPDVEIFRGGTDLGYPFLPKVVRLPIISVAMPNRNPQVRDAPVDAPRDLRIYRELVFQKFETMLHAASDLLSGRPGVLVVPDLGCGAYGNDAVEVGRLLGEALKGHSFLEIHLVGQASFADATESTAKGLR